MGVAALERGGLRAAVIDAIDAIDEKVTRKTGPRIHGGPVLFLYKKLVVGFFVFLHFVGLCNHGFHNAVAADFGHMDV